jgi:hypothetical protein
MLGLERLTDRLKVGFTRRIHDLDTVTVFDGRLELRGRAPEGKPLDNLVWFTVCRRGVTSLYQLSAVVGKTNAKIGVLLAHHEKASVCARFVEFTLDLGRRAERRDGELLEERVQSSPEVLVIRGLRELAKCVEVINERVLN